MGPDYVPGAAHSACYVFTCLTLTTRQSGTPSASLYVYSGESRGTEGGRNMPKVTHQVRTVWLQTSINKLLSSDGLSKTNSATERLALNTTPMPLL